MPPLRPDLVVRLARDFPHLSIILNGGVPSAEAAAALLAEHGGDVDGVMCGRAVTKRPWDFATVDSRLYGEGRDPAASRRQVLADYCAYAAGAEARLRAEGRPEAEAAKGRKWLRQRLLKAAEYLFVGEPGGRRYRGAIAEAQLALARGGAAGGPLAADLLRAAAHEVPDSVLDAGPWAPAPALGDATGA